MSYAFLGLPLGLGLGLVLGLVARREDGWGGYGSVRRRSARLGHIAAVMLPLIAGFYALALGDVAGSTAAWLGVRLWITGGTLLPLVLFFAAWRPRFQFALPVPATALTSGAIAFAVAHLAA
jgi:hypothetical protein